MTVTIHHGDSREVLKGLADASIDSCVCDPPYALVSIGKRFGAEGAAAAKVGKTGAYARASSGFMGKRWDTGETAFDPEFWAEVLRVLKPGAHIVAFGGTRTYHRLACAIEDAGFEIRDQIAWLYGSGFPKSHDVAKGIDKKRDDGPAIVAVAKWLRPHVERVGFAEVTAHFGFKDETMARARWTSASQPNVPRWEQWLALKSLCDFGDGMDAEVWRLNGRKGTPGEAWQNAEVLDVREGAMSGWSMDGATKFVDREVKAANSDAARQWEGWGTALKPALEPVVLARKPLAGTVAANVLAHGTGALNIGGCRVGDDVTVTVRNGDSGGNGAFGRDERVFSRENPPGRWPANVLHDGSDEVVRAFPDTGQGGGYPASGANFGLSGGDRTQRGEALQINNAGGGSAARFFYTAKADAEDRLGSKHPTVKPVDLMAYLCRLVTPPGGVVLDPFAGSGSTGVACIAEGFDAVLIEREAEYIADIERRIAWAQGQGQLTGQEIARRKPQDAHEDLPLFGEAAA